MAATVAPAPPISPARTRNCSLEFCCSLVRTTRRMRRRRWITANATAGQPDRDHGPRRGGLSWLGGSCGARGCRGRVGCRAGFALPSRCSAARTGWPDRSDVDVLTGGRGFDLQPGVGPPAPSPCHCCRDEGEQQCNTRNDERKSPVGRGVTLSSRCDLVLACLTAAVSVSRHLLRYRRRDGEYRSRVLGLNGRIGRDLVPVHLFATGVGLKGVEHELTGLGELAQAEVEVLELAWADTTGDGCPGDIGDDRVQLLTEHLEGLIEVTGGGRDLPPGHWCRLDRSDWLILRQADPHLRSARVVALIRHPEGNDRKAAALGGSRLHSYVCLGDAGHHEDCRGRGTDSNPDTGEDATR